MIMGLGRLAQTSERQRMRRNAFVVIIVATLMVAIPLAFTSYQAVDHSLETRAAIQDVDAWLAETAHNAVSVDVRDKLVVVTVEGQGELKPLRDLANQLAGTLKRAIVVNLRVFPTEVEASGQTSP